MITKFLGDKPFWRVTLRLGFPIAVQNMLTSSFAIVDTLMVSRLGSVALSSVGMAGQWSWFMSIISFGVCSGMSVFASQYWGIGNHKAMRRVLGISLLCIAVLSAVFFFPAFLAPERVIAIFNSDAEVIACGSRYMKIACFSYPAVVLSIILSGFLRNIEKVRIPMYVSMVTTVLNAVFNYGLIFGKFGLPEIGVAGAAAAPASPPGRGPFCSLQFRLSRKTSLSARRKTFFPSGRAICLSLPGAPCPLFSTNRAGRSELLCSMSSIPTWAMNTTRRSRWSKPFPTFPLLSS